MLCFFLFSLGAGSPQETGVPGEKPRLLAER